MNSTTHKILSVSYCPPRAVFVIPTEWEMKDIKVKYTTLYYKGEKQDCVSKEYPETNEDPATYEEEDLADYFDCIDEAE